MAEYVGNKPPFNSQLSPNAYTKAEKRIAFLHARRAGATIKEASRIAGIKDGTGQKWNTVLKREAAKSAARASVADKDELSTIMTDIVRDREQSAAYRVAAAKTLAEVQGYNAPTRSQVLTISVPPSVMAWIEGWEPEPTAPQAIPPNAPTSTLNAVTASRRELGSGACQGGEAGEGRGGAPKDADAAPDE